METGLFSGLRKKAHERPRYEAPRPKAVQASAKKRDLWLFKWVLVHESPWQRKGIDNQPETLRL